jgi:hypothetical protein
MKITSDLTNLTTVILILTVQMFIEWTLHNYYYNIARSNEILGWEGVGNRQLLCFFKA